MWNLCPAAISLPTAEVAPTDPIRVAPNPFDDRITITSRDVGTNARYQLFTLSGTLVLSGALHYGTIDTQGIRAGCYVLDIHKADGGSLGRALVMKM